MYNYNSREGWRQPGIWTEFTHVYICRAEWGLRNLPFLFSASWREEQSSSPVKSLCPQCNMALKSLVSNLVSDGQHSHDGHSTCLADGHHGHAFGPMASSFTAFFPDAVAPHHSDHFLPSIEPETVHQGDAAHLDQFDQSLLAARRPKTYVSFHKEEEEKKEGEWVQYKVPIAILIPETAVKTAVNVSGNEIGRQLAGWLQWLWEQAICDKPPTK